MSTAFRPVRIAVCLLAAVGLVMPLSGCSSAGREKVGKMTCSEFKELDLPERNSKLDSLLNEHDLDAAELNNLMGVRSTVESFCSSGGHDDSPLDDIVDWDSEHWPKSDAPGSQQWRIVRCSGWFGC